MNAPWLSVIMPTYNGARYLGAALESIAVQRETDIEIIVIDDGSTDDTMDILRSFSRRRPMTLIPRAHDGNWVGSVNAGMEIAKGRYLCWLHQDDIWCPDRLAVLRRLTQQHPDAGIFLHPVWMIDAEGSRVGRWNCPFPKREAIIPSEVLLPRLLVQNFLAAPAPMVRADAAARAGLWDEQLWYTADWDYWLKLAAEHPAVYHPTPLAAFRVHAGAQTATCPSRIADVARQYQVVFARHLEPQERTRWCATYVARAARFSVECNLAMMRAAGGKPLGWLRLLKEFLRSGPRGCYVFLRDSRLWERVGGRLRAGGNVTASDDERAALSCDATPVSPTSLTGAP